MPHEGGIMIRTLAAALTTTTCMVALASPAAAQTREFNIPASSLRAALDTFARQSGRQVIYRGDEVRSTRSPGVRGARTAEEALDALLAGTGFKAQRDSSGAFAVAKVGNAPAVADAAASSVEAAASDIVVTGSHIRGAQPSSPTITLSGPDMKRQGNTNTAEALLSLPQNFNGGQNPGVAIGAFTGSVVSNQNFTSGSSPNLRGLGPDATLTLLNGRRLPYDGPYQSVDISGIPLDAVSRIETVLDGASAIYGTDAVAGVVNIIPRRDFNGLELSGGYGAATDGGDELVHTSAIAGGTWTNGGALASVSFNRNTAVQSTDRSFTENLPTPNTIFPAIKQIGALLSGHQSLGSAELTVTGYYAHRYSDFVANFQSVYQPSVIKDTTYWISPELRVALPHSWTGRFNYTYGQNRNNYDSDLLLSDQTEVPGGAQSVCNCNRFHSAEANFEGRLFDLPGGAMRASLGGGFRRETYSSITKIEGSPDSIYGGARTVRYAFAETVLPLIGPDQAIPFIRRLEVNAAIRFEHYSDFGKVATPKLGAIWSLSGDFELKGSWGRSFKAPTLGQLYTPVYAYLFDPAALGAVNTPPGTTALYLYGGNTQLRPERATTYSISASFHPESIRGFRVDVDYFHVSYRQRVQLAIANSLAALSDPQYSPFITSSPSPDLLASTINSAFQYLNLSSVPYDPSLTLAIADGRYQNIGRQTVRGIDITASLERNLFNGQSITTANLSWITGWDQATATAPRVNTVGTVFNPPHLRGRFGESWSFRGLTLLGFANYNGPEKNNLIAPSQKVSPQLTFDITADYQARGSGIVHGLGINLTVRNLFNQRPPHIIPTQPYYPSYDSTNYSPIGRFIDFTLTKHF